MSFICKFLSYILGTVQIINGYGTSAHALLRVIFKKCNVQKCLSLKCFKIYSIKIRVNIFAYLNIISSFTESRSADWVYRVQSGHNTLQGKSWHPCHICLRFTCLMSGAEVTHITNAVPCLCIEHRDLFYKLYERVYVKEWISDISHKSIPWSRVKIQHVCLLYKEGSKNVDSLYQSHKNSTCQTFSP
jgi:hypothetical protein